MSLQAALYFCLSLSLSFLSANQPSLWEESETTGPEESLFLRRIADFWQEGEYVIVKNQIEEFLETFPSSHFSDPLSAALGDLLLREKNYSAALNYYSKITSKEFLESIAINRMECLYHLEWYATLADECESLLEEPLDKNLRLKTTYYLAIALYHQCLNTQKEAETSLKLAQRAQPYFETLLQTELSDETSQAFAHLCCILKDFSKASDIYLELAQKEPEIREEMLFQAALIQAEFDPSQAIETFQSVAQGNGQRSKEAIYNLMVLLFETNQYEKLLQLTEQFATQIPSEKKGMAHLFLGKSCLALKNHERATEELKNFTQEASLASNPLIESGLTALMEASFQSNDLEGMNLALHKLFEIDPTHTEIPKGRFSKALLFKKLDNPIQVRKELENLLTEFPNHSLAPQTLFELAHLEYQAKNWVACRNHSQRFISAFKDSELLPFAWRYLVSASTILAQEDPSKTEPKELLIADLESLLQQEKIFSEAEKNDWQFLLSKTHFDLGQFDQTIHHLSQLIQSSSDFSQIANSYLLLALAYRQGKEDLVSFCKFAEIAIDRGANLTELGPLHASLFNAYLAQAEENEDSLEKAANHLYLAFQNKTAILPENLIWLTEYYKEKFEDAELAERAIVIYKDLLNHPGVERDAILYKLAKLYSLLQKPENQIAVLNELLEGYKVNPESRKNYESEAQFLLAEGYAALGDSLMAASLYDLVTTMNPATRSKVSAKAHLQRAKLRLNQVIEQHLPKDHPETIKALASLKDLMLQKTLINEPVHLEAALEYATLRKKLEGYSLENQAQLLKKIKADFESQEDLLSKDYQKAREKFPEKEKIYLGYIELLNAEMLLTDAAAAKETFQRDQLQAKGKDLLLEIIKEKAHPALVSRASSRLQAVDVDCAKD